MSTYRNKPNYRLDGNNPLGYMGVKPYTPPQMVVRTNAPTQNDVQGFALGTQWLHYKESTPLLSIQYVLCGAAQGVATWVPLNGSNDNPTLPENEVVLGTGVPGLTSVGSLGTTGQILTSAGAGLPPLWAGGGGGGGIGSINVIVIDTVGAGTYTPSPGMLQCTVECVGGGGGAAGTGSNLSKFGDPGVNLVEASTPGGAGGGYCRKLFSATDIGASQGYSVGDGGAGGVGVIPPTPLDPGTITYGGAGGTTTFGTVPILTATGGAVFDSVSQLCAGGTGTGGDININGESVSQATTNNLFGLFTSIGGGSGFYYGPSQQGTYTTIPNIGSAPFNLQVIGAPGGLYGVGAAGGYLYAATANSPFTTVFTGEVGGSGLIIITEYIAA